MVTDKGPRWNAGELTGTGEVKEVELVGLAVCERGAPEEWGAQTVLTFTPCLTLRSLTFTPGWIRAATED